MFKICEYIYQRIVSMNIITITTSYWVYTIYLVNNVITVTLSPWRGPKLAVFLSNVVGLEGQSWQTFEQRLWHGNATVKLDGCFLSGLLTSGQQSQFTNFLSGFSPSATWRALVGAATFNSNTSSMSERPNSCFSLTVHWKSCTSTREYSTFVSSGIPYKDS